TGNAQLIILLISNMKRKTEELFPVIHVYYTNWCPFCAEALRVLSKMKDIFLVTTDLEKEKAGGNIKRVPYIIIYWKGQIKKYTGKLTASSVRSFINKNF